MKIFIKNKGEIRMTRNKQCRKKVRMLLAGMAACAAIATSAVSTTAYAYDREEAVKYASKYWENYNSEYDAFGNDCTNFASQVLSAGGYSVKEIPKKEVSYADLGNVYSTKKYWCNKTYTKKFAGVVKKTDFVTTTTWSNVDQLAGSSFYGLQDYMVTVQGRTRYLWSINEDSIKKLAKKAEKGDIIQIAEANSRFTHTYVVGKVKNGKVYVYAHTGNRDASDNDELEKMRKKKVFEKFTIIALIKA